MTLVKRTFIGMAFTAVIALSLVAGGTDAYARSNTKPPRVTHNAAITNVAPLLSGLLRPLGVTWE